METVELLQIQSQFKELEKLIRELAKDKIVQPEAMESSSTKELSHALSCSQKEFKPVYKNKQGTFSEYSDLGSCIKAIKNALSDNSISYSQPIIETDNGLFLYTIIRHSSGEFIKGKMKIVPPANGDLRKLNSQIVYLKRYCLSGLVGITGSDEDDDGELACKDKDDTFSAGTALTEQAKNLSGYDNSGPIITISQDQLDELNEELDGWPALCEDIKEKWGLRNLSDMPKARFGEAARRIRAIKIERKNDKNK